VDGGMISDSRCLLSAGECLVVTTGTVCAVKMNSLTPLGPVVLPLLKIYYVSAPRLLLYALCNEILCARRLRGSRGP
jgi:hypothetical protein